MGNESKEIRERICDEISKIKDNSKLDRIMAVLSQLNDEADVSDGALNNFLQALYQKLSGNKQSQARKIVNDLLDNYDSEYVEGKKKNNGYPPAFKEKVKKAVEEIVRICQEDFGDKVLKVLKGS
ncbi:MAG: hypothetical protein LBQ40_02515 [Clostridiales bacterium]|jgi:hypothetical protein|nr:hypothetical protein [Clostridiales bacterium]